MATGFSGDTAELLLEWFGGIGTPTQPTDFYIQWHTADPGAAGTTAVSTGLATRTQLGGTPEWQVGTADDGEIENSTAGETPTATGGDTITHFSIWSASTSGTFYFSGSLAASKTVASGDKLTWGVGDLTVSIGIAA